MVDRHHRSFSAGLGQWGIGVFLLLVFGCGGTSSEKQVDFEHSPALSPAEELARFELKPGLRIELVASEPLVEDPVIVTFDEDGRLWVVEMRGFMPDIDGNGEEERIGRISILWDDDGNGEMDRRSTFMDSLILPRALAVVKGGALVAENQPLWFVEDTDGDLKADKKTLIDPSYGGSGLPEHSANGLWRGMDNWYYNAKSRVRYKREGDAWIQDSTEFRGQWGLSHDDKGRLYYNYNWSQLHADLVPPNYLSRNQHHTSTSGLDVGLTINRSIFPIRPNIAVNRGYVPGSLDEEGKLLEFTSASAPLVYRGTALPDFYGDVFVSEPAGNLIKRNITHEEGFSLTSEFAYPYTEFLASTDERFRPVSLATGPDGALYVVDMYRGLIQHGAYITPYLREQTLKRDLVLPVHMGRIWRVVPEDWQAPAPAPLADAALQDLVLHLSHPDGWYRDTAQRLLVERQDLTVLPLLRNLVQEGEDARGRLHALWTLQGLNESDTSSYFGALNDENPTVQAAAIRILDHIAQNNEAVRSRFEQALLKKSLNNTSPEVITQMALTAGNLDKSIVMPLLLEISSQYVEQPVIRDAVLSGLEDYEFAFFEAIWDLPGWKQPQAEKSIFLEMLTTAVARKNDRAEITSLMARLGEALPANDWRADALLTGLSLHARQRSEDPIQLAAAPVILTNLQSVNPGQQAQLQPLMRMFEWPGHKIEQNSVQTNHLTDPETQALFAQGRQQFLSGCAGCHGNNGAGLPRFAPPLVQSEWVLGSEELLTRLVLHGLEGPIDVNGKRYDAPDILPVMPGHSVLDDREIASILTYIRLAWGHQAPPVVQRTVGRIRHGSQGRVMPWTAEELLELTFE